jgi:predicted XRE-type DNA-binding protein
MRRKLTPSTGNVFEDLGFSREEAENLRIRAALMRSLKKIIEDSGLTQAMAAEAFGVTQPRISDLIRGKIDLFSIDTLVNMLAAAGHHVEVTVESGKTQAA